MVSWSPAGEAGSTVRAGSERIPVNHAKQACAPGGMGSS